MPEQQQTNPAATASFVQATLKDGTKVISEFSKLTGLENYGAAVLSGRKPFNAWEVVSRVHPASGEPCLVRRRRLIAGDQIAELEQVEPREGVTLPTGPDANLDPSFFQPVTHIQRGERGLHVFPVDDGLPEYAQAGVGYPVHTESEGYGFVRYVILRAASAPGDEEVRHYLDARGGSTPYVSPGAQSEYTSDADEDDEF